MSVADADQHRRRMYAIRRSQVTAAAKRGPSIEVGRMSDTALWACLESELQDLERRARGSTNVESYLTAARCVLMASELRARGTQLGLGF